ncbi:MAG: DUF362 domain-containing protein [Candidatus Aminicenantes bacterium]|uniref:DUF362 domain-containing protein n=1 Tax=Candidatus Saccharicenans subterraneus TaxID=2508984 RepID=A0A3E2BKW7_9BACT|nr:DUF362 domain-containing protein [Candidatus Aminicenantes bacterium]RFT15287.1 MAG: hypothetical protein OP8BY_0396 [Candidatus Saccharicenans subterraneum]
MKEKRTITRRDFIRGTVGTTLGLTLVTPDWVKKSLAAEAVQKAGGKSLVLLVRDENVLDDQMNVNKKILAGMVDRILLEITGKKDVKQAWLSLVSPKDVVGLVPTPMMNPTHQELLDVIKESLVAAGLPEENIRNAQGRKVDLEPITALISVPGLKAHWLTGIGTVIKNYIMFSGAPRNYHYEDSAKLGEIWHLPQVKGKTRLIIVDALRPVCDKGPQFDPRYRWPYKGLLASTDPVALDAVGLKIIQAKRDELRGEPWPISPPPICIEAADTVYKLGQSKLENIEIKKLGWAKEILV